ncbi:MAG: hypothetical protein HN921_10780 [Bacteroidetes bacterium]|jgi:hypothetical protein|nr:hypothetical protein [Bacteroidota bacterium]
MFLHMMGKAILSKWEEYVHLALLKGEYSFNSQSEIGFTSKTRTRMTKSALLQQIQIIKYPHTGFLVTSGLAQHDLKLN